PSPTAGPRTPATPASARGSGSCGEPSTVGRTSRAPPPARGRVPRAAPQPAPPGAWAGAKGGAAAGAVIGSIFPGPGTAIGGVVGGVIGGIAGGITGGGLADAAIDWILG